MVDFRERAFCPRSKSRQVECQAFTKQFDPDRVVDVAAGCLRVVARPAVCGDQMERIFARRIMGNRDRPVAFGKIPDGGTSGPFAGGKQQMQPRSLSMLPFNDFQDPLQPQRTGVFIPLPTLARFAVSVESRLVTNTGLFGGVRTLPFASLRQVLSPVRDIGRELLEKLVFAPGSPLAFARRN